MPGRILVGLGATILLLDSPASAAQVEDVRVGLHEKFTRVVIETDTTVKYDVDHESPAAIVVHLPARSAARRVSGQGPWIDSVSAVGSDPGSVVRIALKGDSPTAPAVSDHVLRDPPRIVLDVSSPPPIGTPEASSRREIVVAQTAPSAPVREQPASTQSPAPHATSAHDASVDSEMAFHRGVAAYGQGRYDEARAEFERVIAADPEDDVAFHYLGLTAQAQGDFEAARGYLERSLELAPDDNDTKFDLGTVLLEVGEPARARDLFDQVLRSQPDRARAHLYAGIADYRLRNYGASLAHMEKAEKLDPELARDTRYYTGLAYSFLGRYSLASGAFSAVTEQSPNHPLGRSAEELRRAAQEVEPADRWTGSLTAGAEWDTNPLVVGDLSGFASTVDREHDWRGVFRAETSYQIVDSDRFDFEVGYDGYLSLHDKSSQVDLQTHLGYVQASAYLDPVLFNVRYDYSYTFVDLDERFLSLHRLIPSLSMAEGSWGVIQLAYLFQHHNYFNDSFDSSDSFSELVDQTDSISERDGNQHSVGVNQFFLVGDPVDQLWIGVLGDFDNARASEFDYSAFELAAGAAIQPLGSLLPGLVLSFDYRYVHRNYDGESSIEPKRRHDRIHRVTWSLAYPIGEYLEISFAGSYTDNGSNIGVYDYDRIILGTYLRLQF